MDRTVTLIPTIVLDALERLAREDVADACAFDDLAAADWDTYRVARMRFLAGLGDGRRPSPTPVHDPLALREPHG